MSRALCLLLNWKSFPSKTSFQRHEVWTPQDIFYCSSYHIPCPLSHLWTSVTSFPIPPPKPCIICPPVTRWFSFSFNSFSNPFPLLQFSMSPLLLSKHLPLILLLPIALITDYHILWSARKYSYFSFFVSYSSPRNSFSPLKYYILSYLCWNVEFKP